MFLEGSGDEGPLISAGQSLVTEVRGLLSRAIGTDCFLQIHLAILWKKDCES